MANTQIQSIISEYHRDRLSEKCVTKWLSLEEAEMLIRAEIACEMFKEQEENACLISNKNTFY